MTTERSTLGSVQSRVLSELAQYMQTTTELARHVYGLKIGVVPTRSQSVGIRRVLRTLERGEVVRLTGQFRGRERCWELTGKLAPIPEKKKGATLPAGRPRLVPS
jgi:hypothetical protein